MAIDFTIPTHPIEIRGESRSIIHKEIERTNPESQKAVAMCEGTTRAVTGGADMC
jgi:hypothetical protein